MATGNSDRYRRTSGPGQQGNPKKWKLKRSIELEHHAMTDPTVTSSAA